MGVKLFFFLPDLSIKYIIARDSTVMDVPPLELVQNISRVYPLDSWNTKESILQYLAGTNDITFQALTIVIEAWHSCVSGVLHNLNLISLNLIHGYHTLHSVFISYNRTENEATRKVDFCDVLLYTNQYY